jgi:CBS-domain-containing membrane protein
MQATETLFDLTAAALMTREVITIRPETSVPDAGRMLAEARARVAPVVDSEGRCVGVFSLAAAARPELKQRADRRAPRIPGCVCSEWEVVERDWETLPSESVSWYMTPDPVLVRPETPVGERHGSWRTRTSADWLWRERMAARSALSPARI